MRQLGRWTGQIGTRGFDVRRALRAIPISASTWLVLALTSAFSALPIFARPSYESALFFGLVLPPITAVSASRIASYGSGGYEYRFGACLGRAIAHAFVLLAVLSVHATMGGWCSKTQDLALLLLGPAMGILNAGCWGCIAGLGSGALGRIRKGRQALRFIAALLGPASGIAIGLLLFYDSPVVFTFDPFVGFFAGSPYDTGFDPTSRLLTYRAGTLGSWLFVWSVLRQLDRHQGISLALIAADLHGVWQRTERSVLVIGVFGVGLSVAITCLGERLGHRSSSGWIRQSLSRNTEFGRCEVVHVPSEKQAAMRRLARDCDAWLNRLERRLGTAKLDHVTAFVFESAEQKERLMGAARTQIAKPWRREIYLNRAAYPDDVVGHELAHVVAGQTARGPFKIAGTLAGWIPDPGLIEGLAVALAPDEDAELTSLEWSAALAAIGKLPTLEGLFSLGFLQHSGPLAYTVAGAFVEWVAQSYGKRALRAWYGGESLESITGNKWSELERRFRGSLATIALPPMARDAALAKFQRLGVYQRRCPHAVDRTLAEADMLLAAGDAQGACAHYSVAQALDPTEIRARFGLGSCAERIEPSARAQRLEAERVYRAIAEDPAQPRTTQLKALERIADLALSQGELAQARTLYAQIEPQVFDIDWRRSLLLKLAVHGKAETRAVSALFVGVDGELAWDVAVQELLRWSEDAPDDGTADYLLGRNFWQRGRESVAVEHLDRALSKRIAIPELHAEAVRQRVIVACAREERALATSLATSLVNSPNLPTARKLGLLRLVERCAGTFAGDDWPESAAGQGGSLATSTPGQPTFANGALGSASPPTSTALIPASPPSNAADVRNAAAASGAVPSRDDTGAKPYDSDGFVCPAGMKKIRGGEFRMGAAERGKHSPDESPRFLTKLRSFCLDETEVTVSAYSECVARGECKPSTGKSVSCNFRYSDRGNHPMNCVDHAQAAAFCHSLKKRLPTEAEWEFAARGGKSDQKYPWGEEPPDGRACWKRPYSCEVRSFPAGAFGLYDMSGNVWEWTSSDYAPYPWSTPIPGQYPLKIYRGGGWSRRFEKWMHLGLRNRAMPQEAGAHLGLRCAMDVSELRCPFERDANGACLLGVLEVECSEGRAWNGQRCAKPSDPLCPEGFHPHAGRGCVRDVAIAVKGEVLDLGSVRRDRTPNLDPDCRSNQPSRPKAYRLSGSTHASRNAVAKRDGCKNRDVGAGWNSTCCP